MSTTTVLYGLTRTLERHNVDLGGGRTLRDLIDQTDSGAEFRDRYQGSPAQEFAARLDHPAEKHGTALRRLADQLTLEEIWNIAANAPDGHQRVQWLLRAGLLPSDDRLLTLGTGHRDILDTVLAQQYRYGTDTAISATALLDYTIRTQAPAPLLLHRMAQRQLTDADATRVVAYVDQHLRTTPADVLAMVKDSGYGAALTDDQADALLRRGTLADIVVVARLHRPRLHEKLSALLDNRPALALLASDPSWSPALADAITAHVDDLPVDLIGPAAAARILDRVPVTDPDRLAVLVPLASSVPAWLTGTRFHHNAPTADTVAALIERGVVTGAHLVEAFKVSTLRHRDWAEDLVCAAPGVTAALLAQLDAWGASTNTPSDYDAEGIATVLAIVAGVLGHDPALWERFITAGEASPFRNPALTIAQAVDVYRTRWAIAAARRGV